MTPQEQDARNYQLGVKGTDWVRYTCAKTPGKAKVRYWRDVRESCPYLPFTAITCRVIKNLPPTKAELAQREADEFNRQYPVGSVFRYWTFLKEGEPTGTGELYHAATVVCGHASAWIKGAGSCISLTHVEAIR